MEDITGRVVIVLKDGLGVLAGEVIGERRTGNEDFIVLASRGEFTVDGAIIDNQVNVGKIQHILLEDNEAIAFVGNTLDSAYSLGTPPEDDLQPEADAVEAAASQEEGGEAPTDPTQVALETPADVVVTVDELPTISSETIGLTLSGDAPNVSSTDGQAAEDETTSAEDVATGAAPTDETVPAPTGDSQTAPADDESTAAPAKKAPRGRKTV